MPGEHDLIGNSKYLDRFGKGTKGDGWSNFDHHGVHFIGLVNVAGQGDGKGLGILGDEQLDWLKTDLAGRGASTPIVVFGHVPLWAVYPDWGWGTQDSQRAVGYLKRFGSVTVLNGHIHQIAQNRRELSRSTPACSTGFSRSRLRAHAPRQGPLKNVTCRKVAVACSA